MADEPEVIKEKELQHQIDETASSLKDKVEQLEQQVLGTVKGTTEAVTETVETVKDTVAETIETVKETVHETVATVKRTFDLKYQVRQHPWLMVGGSVAAGFTVGKLLGSRESRAETTNGRYTLSESTDGYATSQAASTPAVSEPAAEPSRPGLFSALWDRFDTEIAKVKQTAIGMIFGYFRDMAKDALPPTLASKVDEVMDSVTTKLGGEPVRGPVAVAGEGHSYR
jgi:ElaB/YqjD/DUF883 family membrane-anchored ribosome-binding protein